jgi:hypothetical protein
VCVHCLSTGPGVTAIPAHASHDDPFLLLLVPSIIACDSTLGFLGLDEVECSCTGKAEFGNAMADAACSSGYRCLDESSGLFCGTSAISATMGGGVAGMYGVFNSCMLMDMGMLEEPFSLMDDYKVCFSAQSIDGLSLDSCEATIKDEPCMCQVCTDRAVPAFTLDCSMINLSPMPDSTLFGPKIDTCSLLDFTGAD